MAFLLVACSTLGGDTVAQDFEDSGSETLVGLIGKIDVSCILRSWRVVGVSVCVVDGHPRPCVIIENAYPVGVLESVRAAWGSHLKEGELMLRGLRRAAEKLAGRPGGASHTAGSAPGSSLLYSEARAFAWVPQVAAGGLPIAVPDLVGAGLAYASELDRIGWRDPVLDLLLKLDRVAGTLPACDVKWPVALDGCAGSWGAFYPRIGFVNHPSYVVGGYVQALRGARVAADPVGRVAVGAYPYEPRTGHFVQPVAPGLKGCVGIGAPVTVRFEAGAGSIAQAQMAIHFGVFRQCKGCWGARLAPARVPR